MRIIAGKCRGRVFDAPEGVKTRPTHDRVKESLFGSIQFDIPGATVLDLFSGSGNISLEAASRGAKLCVAADVDAGCVSLIRRNAAALGLSELIRTLQGDYREILRLLAGEGFKADIVYLDAPYASGFSQDAARIVFEQKMLSDNGRLFIEHSGEVNVAPSPLYEIFRTKQYGRCFITELRWNC